MERLYPTSNLDLVTGQAARVTRKLSSFLLAEQGGGRTQVIIRHPQQFWGNFRTWIGILFYVLLIHCLLGVGQPRNPVAGTHRKHVLLAWSFSGALSHLDACRESTQSWEFCYELLAFLI